MKLRGADFRISWRRRAAARRVAAATIFVMAALTAVPVADASDAGRPGFPLPELGSLFNGHTGGPEAAATPKQPAGSAEGRSHTATAASTRAGTGSGKPRGKGKGELDADAGPHARSVAAGPSAKGTSGFDAKTSKEAVGKRTKTSKTYDNADGTTTVDYFADQVNYTAPDGSLQPIDATLVPASPSKTSSVESQAKAGTGRLVRKAADSAVSLAASGADANLMTVGAAGASVTFGLSGAAAVAAATSGAQATYASILPGVDLKLQATNTGVKQTLVLKSADAPSDYVFPYTVTGGLKAKVTDRGLEFDDAAGKAVLLIPNAIMTDSKPIPNYGSGAQSNAIGYSLATTADGRPALRMSLDRAWLHDAARTFPVLVDPTTADPFRANSSATMDTTNSPMGTYDGDLKIGSYDGVHKGASMVQFTGITSFKNAHIVAAQVNLWHTYSSYCGGSEPIYLNQITADWNVSTISSYPGFQYGAAVGSTNVTGGQCGGGTGEWDYVHLNSDGLAALQSWAQGTAVNYGFLVTGETSNADGWKRFNSNSEGGVVIPSMTVTYSPDVAPTVDSQYPGNNVPTSTLTPELMANGHDPDTFPSASLQYRFQVVDGTLPAGSQVVADSGLIGSGDYTVPAGKLSWNKTYSWTVQTYDGFDYSPNAVWNYFTAQAPQPLITSALSQNTSGRGFDAAAGNYTTHATDATVAGVGPALQVTRDYNSRDPRTAGAFGAAWSSLFDAKAAEQYLTTASGSTTVNSVAITDADGSETGYGRNADGSFAPPLGRYARVVQVVGGGYTLTDKSDTVYSFTQALGNGVYGISSVADAAGRTVTFSWTNGQITAMTSAVTGRALHVGWTTPSAGATAHVGTVTTDPVSAGAPGLTWTYSYTGDQLTSVCSPVDHAPACSKYSYRSGSPFPAAVLDTAPVSYWRLNELAGSTAASSVVANEGGDNLRYTGVTLGQGSALSGSSAGSATFAGGQGSYASGDARNLAAAGQYTSVGAWFKTTVGGGVIFYYGDQPLSNAAATGINTPALYVGNDGLLHGCFATGSCATTQISSASTVTDGVWHYALLSGAATSQTLYLDGVKQGTAAGTIQNWNQPYIAIGAGVGGGGWPFLAAAVDGFTGSLSDVAVWNQALSGADASALYGAGKRPTSLVGSITNPSGSTAATVAYNPADGTVAAVTDQNGGSWTVPQPTASGSSQVFRSSVLAGAPSGYWRLGDPAGTASAADEVAADGQSAGYGNVTLGSAGPFADATAATFDGTSSAVQLPAAAVPLGSAASASLWFKTSTPTGVLLNAQGQPLALPPNPTAALYTSSMNAYIGPDGFLYGGFLAGGAHPQLSSKKSVADGKWHHMVLSVAGTGQALYLDGAQVDGTTTAQPLTSGQLPYVYVGAGTSAAGQTNLSTITDTYFNGSISDVAFSPSQLAGAQVSAMWSASQSANPSLPGLSSLTPAVVTKVLTPGAQVATFAFDGTSYAAGAAKTWTLPAARMAFQADGNLVIARLDTGATIWSTNTGGNPNAVLAFQTDGGLVVYSDSTKATVLWASGTNLPSAAGNTATLGPDGAFTIFKSDGTPLFAVSSPVTDAAGVVTTFLDPNHGNRTLDVVDALGKTTRYGYDTSGFLNTVTDPDGDTTTTGHDLRGNLVSKTTCQVQSSNTCSTAYYTYWPDDVTGMPGADPRDDLLTSYRDPRSASSSDNTYLTSYTYDAMGDQTSVTTPPVPGFPSGRTGSTAYTTASWPAADTGFAPSWLPNAATSAGGKTTSTQYLHNGDIFSTRDAAGLLTTYSYDNLGRVTGKTVVSDTYPAGLTTTYTLDGLGRVAGQTDPAVSDRAVSPPGSVVHTPSTTTTFTADGQVASISVADLTGHDTTRTVTAFYNDHDQIGSIKDPAGQVSTYGYDAFGYRTKTVDPRGIETDTAYDANHNELSSTLVGYTGDPATPGPAANLMTSSKAYDPAGRLASVADALGNTTTYTYTDNGLTATITKTDPNGKNPFVEQANHYDPAGNLVSRTTNNGVTVTAYTVDAASRVTTTTVDPPGSNPANTATPNVNRTTSVTYTPDDAVASSNLRDGSGWNRTVTYGFDLAGRLTSQAVHQSSTSSAPAAAAGLTGSWPLADGSATTAADASGNNRPGVVSGGASWSADHGGSAVFDGSTGLISTGTTAEVDTSQSYTFSAWVKPANTNSNQVVMALSGNTNPAAILAYNTSVGSWIFDTTSNDTNAAAWMYAKTPASSVPLGAWTHLAGTYDVSSHTLSLYVNGALAGTAVNYSPWKAPKGLNIGTAWLGNQQFAGSLSDVRLYNRALPAADVQALYANAPNHQVQNGLAGQWKLNDGSATTVADVSGNNAVGTMSGGASWSADHNGSAVFDGSTGQITTAAPEVDTSASYTLAAWVKPTNTSSNQVVLALSGNTNPAIMLGYNTSVASWIFDATSNDTNAAAWTYAKTPASSVPIGAWTHLVGTYEVSTHVLSLYVNGTLAGTAVNYSPWKAPKGLNIGTAWLGNQPFAGRVSGVQVYNRALSATEVSTLATGGSLLGTDATVTTSRTLDARGLPTSETDADGNKTTYLYDEAGRQAVSTAPAVSVETAGASATTSNPVTAVGYDTFGEVRETKDADGNVTTVGYDPDGHPTSTTLPNYTAPGTTTAVTAVTARTYDPDGNVLTTTDPLGDKTTYTYDQRNLPALVTAPDAGVTHTTYDVLGEPLIVTDPTGATSEASYDWLSRKTTTTAVERYPSAQRNVTTYDYGPGGWLTATTTQTGFKTSVGYDNVGEVASTTDGAGDVTTYGYDFLGDRRTTTLPDGTSTRTDYDALSRPTGVTTFDAAGKQLTHAADVYDGAGNVRFATDARGTTSSFTYDALGRVVTASQPVSGSVSINTGFGYDAVGNRTRYTDGNGQVWQTTFNPWNLPESQIEPATAQYADAPSRTFVTAYDPDARPISQTQPGGVNVASSYDAVGNLTAQSGTGAQAASAARSFTYDKAGRMLTAATAATANQAATNDVFTYDDRGLLLTATGSAGASSFDYNEDGAMTSRTDAAGTAAYTYDTKGHLTAVNDPASGNALSYGYNKLNQVDQIGYGSGDKRTFVYDPLHRLKSDTLNTGSNAQVAGINYDYDENGNLKSKVTTGFATSASNAYTYDTANRLTGWNNGTATVAYAYDGDSNRTQAGATTFTYDTRDQLVSDGTTSYAYTARGTQSVGSGGVQAGFDAFGQGVTAGGQTYTHDALGRVTSDATSGGTTQTLSYSGMDDLLAGDGTNTYSRDPLGGPLGVGTVGQAAGSGSLAWTDLHGDVVGDFSAGGAALTGSAGYDPLGRQLGTNTLTGSLGYQGEYTERSNGRVDMAARWYDPANGQFTSRDTQSNSPLPNSANANSFAYGNGNPLTNADPSGHSSCGRTIGPVVLVPEAGVEIYAECELLSYIFGQSDDVKNFAPGGTFDRFPQYGNDFSSVCDDLEPGTRAYYRSGCGTPPKPSEHSGSHSEKPGSGHGGSGGGHHVPCTHGVKAGVCLTVAVCAAQPELCATEVAPELPVALAPVAVDPVPVAIDPAPIHGPGTAVDVDLSNAHGTEDEIKDDEKTRGGGGTCTSVAPLFGQPKGEMGGWVDYFDQKTDGQASGVLACLTEDSITGGSVPSATPPGFEWAQNYARHLGVKFGNPAKTPGAFAWSEVINRCHLLAKELGGDGSDLRNLSTCGRDANADVRGGEVGQMENMRSFENQTMELLTRHDVVLYSVTPLYKGARTVPYAYLMAETAWTAEGTIDLSGAHTLLVPNVLNTPDNGWVNLGTAVDSRYENKPEVPTGSTP